MSEVIKAGSLGDGTAVPGDYDIDLVVYSRSKYSTYTKINGHMTNDCSQQVSLGEMFYCLPPCFSHGYLS